MGMVGVVVVVFALLLVGYIAWRESIKEREMLMHYAKVLAEKKKGDDYIFVDPDQDEEDISEEHAGLLAENEDEEEEALFW